MKRAALTLKQIVLLCMLLCSFLGTFASTFDAGTIPTISTSSETIDLGQDVTISIDAPTLIGYAIRIEGPKANFRHTIQDAPIVFTPPINGTYNVILYNTLTGDLYDEKLVYVTTPPEVQALDTDAISSRFITLSKDSYAVDETVAITINYRSDDFTLRIIAPSTIYNFLGEPQRDIVFQPRITGDYEIQLVAQAGIIEKKLFTVSEDVSQVPINLPNTNIKNLVRDHTGKVADSTTIRILDDGVVVQNGFDATKRYEVRLTPSNPHVQQVSLSDVKLTGELDVGIETVIPQTNPAGRGSTIGAFALDPSRVDFTNGFIRVQSPGDKIYKCTDYNFTTQTCFGEHILIMETTPGMIVDIPIDPIDPLYTFVDTGVSCSCTYTQSPSANSGTISCNTYCAVTINGPGGSAESGFIEEIQYVADLTINPDSSTISNGNHEGDFDHDQTQGNGNEQNIGTSTATSTTTLTWTATGLPSSGSDSFSDLDCDNWPTDCSNYDVYLSASADFNAPGNSKKSPSITISLDTLNVTWNYTLAGALTVSLNEPLINSYTANSFVGFNFTPATSAANITNCSLYVNDSSWGIVNSSTSITNNASNLLYHQFSGDGEYLWNVWCEDSDSNEKFASSNFTLYVDTSGPTMQLESPANASVETTSVVVLQYNVSDSLGDIDNCSVYVNGTQEDYSTSITQATTQEFTLAFANGDYLWSVACFDEAGNQGVSESRLLTINRTPYVWGDFFYETDTANCAGTGLCEIDLLENVDGATNTKSLSIPGGDVVRTLINATTQYLGGSGVYIPGSDTITFRADFSAYSGGQPYVSWHLYNYHTNGSQTLICSAGNDDTTGQRIQAVGFETDTCTPSGDVYLSGTDRVRLELRVFNDHPSQASSITHDFDDVNSFVDFTTFYTIGTLSANLYAPTSNITITQSDTANVSCESICTNGYCLSSDVYVQYRALGGVWTNISSSGNLTLDTGETNPHSLGDLLGNLSTSANETFSVVGNQASVNEVRCVAQSLFNTASTDPIRLTVGDSQSPTVALVSPAEGVFLNSDPITFTYNVTDASTVDNCSIVIDGVINATNTTITNPGNNNFFIGGIGEGAHNWTVFCTDDGGLQGNASETRNFTVDRTQPNIVLNSPSPAATIPFSTITFNWTVTDNRPENLTCDVYIDGSINVSGLSTAPSIDRTTEISGFDVGLHNWSVSCIDSSTNANVSETRTFNVTDVAPTVTLFSPLDGAYEGSSTLLLQYNASDNNALESCTLVFDGVINATNATPVVNNQINNFTLPGVNDGLHNWTVNCTDGSLFDIPSPYEVYVDTLDPTLLLVSPSDAALSSSTLQFRFNYTDITSPNGTCDIQYNTSATSYLISSISALSGVITQQNEPGVLDGIYSWNATCYDLGNNSANAGLELFNVSQAPTVVLGTPAPNAYSNGGQVNFTFTPTDNDGFDNCTLRLLTGPNVSDTINQSPIISGSLNSIVLTDLASGSHTWSVSCVDNGTFINSVQASARFLFIDNENPTLSLAYPIDLQVNTSAVNFNWTTNDDQDLTLACDLYLDGALNVSSIAASAGEYTNQTINGLTNGLHNWSVYCADDAGNFNQTSTVNFTVAVPPNVTLTDPDDDAYFNISTGITFGYTPSANANLDNCTLYIDGLANETNTSPQIGVNSFFFIDFDQSEEGSHEWNVYCADIDGLSGGSDENRTFTLDFTPPNISLTTPGSGVTVSNNNVSFSFIPDDNLAQNITCNLTVNGGPEAENQLYDAGVSATESVLFPDGLYYWNVTCVDTAGNFNTSLTRNYTVYAPPNVTLLTPSNNTATSNSSLDLIYLPEDGFAISYCNLTLNGAYNNTDAIIETNDNNTFSLTGLDEGIYNWSVLCEDQDNNIGVSDTWYFIVDFFAPNITLYTPLSAAQLTNADVTFNFTAHDTFDNNVSCNLVLDSVIEGSGLNVINATPYLFSVYNVSDGVHYWNATCVDDVNNSNTSETRSFNMSSLPLVNLDSPLDGSWLSNTSVFFYFTSTDNDGFGQCNLIWDGSNSTVNATIANGAQNVIINSTLGDGVYNWSVTCTDNGTYANTYTATNYTLNLDRVAPNITLYDPAAGAIASLDVLFNYSLIEETSPFANCSILLDGSNITFDTLSNGSFFDHIESTSYGLHYWNVTCTDYASNIGFSELRNFTVVVPDVAITSENITFSDSSPEEGDTITIFANIYNLGQGAANNFTVQFYLGDPDIGGTQIGANQSVGSLASLANITLNVTHTAIIGQNNIFVVVDAPLSTNGSLPEIDETNNEANNTISVGHYEIFSGTTNDELRIDDSTLTSLYTWAVDNSTGGNIFVADAESTIDFLNLAALSRTTGEVYTADDFAELDTALGSSNLDDSINATYTLLGSPINTQEFLVFSQSISNVPVVNSTNTTSFQTGILWDTSDGGIEYNGSQDVVFITRINESQAGYLGTYDYEVKVPATLRDYVSGGGTISFYAEVSG